MLSASRLFTAVFCLLASSIMALPAQAGDYLSFNAGVFNALSSDNNDAQFGAEYRFSAIDYNLRPVIGGFFTNEGAAYGYVGVNWDIALIPNQLYLIPNFAVGAYHQGDSKDLGGVLEFRSGVELAYQFENAHQVGVAFNHLSNAHIYNRNPGTETIMVTYSVPISSLMGN
jgi:lipid A 3-O-deacylase